MNLTDNERWSVDGRDFTNFAGTEAWCVRDGRVGMCDRPLRLVKVNWSRLDQRQLDWEAHSLREDLRRVGRHLSRNLTFFPELVDVVEWPNSELPEQIGDDVGLVVALPDGGRLHPKTSDAEYVGSDLYKTCKTIGQTLQALHEDGLVIQEIPLRSVILSETTKKPYLTHFQTLRRWDGERAFSHEVRLRPRPKWAAPECFDDRSLSRATDIYALGRMLLALLGVPLENRAMTPEEISEWGDNLVGDFGIGDHWKEAFLGMVHPDPAERFQSVDELHRFVGSRGQYNPRKSVPLVYLDGEVETPHGFHFQFDELGKLLEDDATLAPRIFVTPQKPSDNKYFRVMKDNYRFDFLHYDPVQPPEEVVSEVLRSAMNMQPEEAVIVGEAGGAISTRLQQNLTGSGCRVRRVQDRPSADTFHVNTISRETFLTSPDEPRWWDSDRTAVVFTPGALHGLDNDEEFDFDAFFEALPEAFTTDGDRLCRPAIFMTGRSEPTDHNPFFHLLRHRFGFAFEWEIGQNGTAPAEDLLERLDFYLRDYLDQVVLVEGEGSWIDVGELTCSPTLGHCETYVVSDNPPADSSLTDSTGFRQFIREKTNS